MGMRKIAVEIARVIERKWREKKRAPEERKFNPHPQEGKRSHRSDGLWKGNQKTKNHRKVIIHVPARIFIIRIINVIDVHSVACS